MKKTLLLVFTLALSFSLQAQRLPGGVVPEHYQLAFTPDLNTNTFAGDETIDVRILKPTTTITLDSAEIKFKSATVESHGQTQTGKVTFEEDREQAHIIVPRTLAAGPAKMHIVFDGILNNELRGFYLSQTPKRKYAVTQFEPTDARRAFPCFDEPNLKATFAITLTVNKGDTAISNGRILTDTPGPGEDKHTLKFSETPKISTYLVAMLVGDFQCTSGSSDGIPIRACATPDKVEQGKFALESAEYVMHYYDDYFGIKYPFGKLDLIAVPDFEAGAMENVACITYRESDMLLDPKVASIDNYENVASVVAHEMAHQWFGDLVTMKWWDNIWLNEGFATWMESKPVAQWKPEWKIPLDEVAGTNETLSLDAMKTTRPIRQKAETPAEINQLFDGIAYGKAASVLRMVEYYVGPEVFRKGVQNYLHAHEYANATAEDFWNAETRASNKPVDKIMSSFVVQPGEPLLHIANNDGKLDVSQERFFSDRQLLGTAQQQLWVVPFCVAPAAQGSTSTPDCKLLNQRGQEFPSPASGAVIANAGAHGYYRTEYDQSERAQLTQDLEHGLSPAERISLLGDDWALMRVGRLSISDYLNLVSQLKTERIRQVWSGVLDNLDYVHDKLVTTQDKPQYEEFIRNLLKPVYTELSHGNDTPEQKALRADIFIVLGMDGRDPQTIEEAKKIAEQSLQDPGSVDPLMAREALPIAASVGDEALFDQIAAKLKDTTDQILRGRYMGALSSFEKPELVKKALELAVSGQIPNQDSAAFLSSFLRNPGTRDEAWKFIQTHWDEVQKQFTTWSGAYVVGSAGQFCSEDKASDVKAFFSVHEVRASDRALRDALERINSCADLRKLQQENLQSWLFNHTSGQAAAGAK
ncbi:MAG TPA: M1 family metallopeptidase [Terriglobales bacterium]|nr:M1 family metallopeptidase [Terriglobales bacterium]